MDVKAMARSKRSHTKHHQPRKPHRQAAHPIASSSSNNPKAAVKDEGRRKRSDPGSSLPSNWDRYYNSEEEDGLLGSDSAAPNTDVVMPKSKGADFSFLISEAKSQSPANFSASLDDIFPDFSEGLGSMLSVRGESILSLTGGDNFLMEDEAVSIQEVPFLSLNLQTLAEDLARIDLAKRLFIEEDILPPELRVRQKDERDTILPNVASVEQSSKVDDLAFQNSTKAEEGRTVSKESSGLQSDGVDTTHQAPWPSRQERQLDDKLANHKSDSFGNLHSRESEIGKKMPSFEADLDMLLDSFNETNLAGSSNADSNAPSAITKQKAWASIGSNLNNDIDELLEVTSNSALGHAVSHSLDVNAESDGNQSSSSLHPGTKSKVMEDFDSWLDSM